MKKKPTPGMINVSHLTMREQERIQTLTDYPGLLGPVLSAVIQIALIVKFGSTPTPDGKPPDGKPFEGHDGRLYL